jgi:protein TonB
VPPQITAIQAASPDEPVASGLHVDVIVLSAESALYESIRSCVGERNPVWRARSAEEAVDMLLLGRCGVLIVDMASVPTHSAPLIERIHAQFPDVVLVVAGSRDDEGALAGLVSEGLIYRYMHKPLSAKRAGMFLSAAIQQYVERRGRRDFAPLLPLAGRLPERVDARYWAISAAVIVTVVLGVAMLKRDEPDPPLLVPPVASRPDVVSSTPRADPVLSRARAALAAGRYEAPEGRNALDLYRAVLLARPDYPEARIGLERTLGAIVADAERHWQDGDRAEAQRLLHRVLEAEPAQPAAQALLASMQPAVVEDTSPADQAVATTSVEPTAPPASTAALASESAPLDARPRALEPPTVAPVVAATAPPPAPTVARVAAKPAATASGAAIPPAVRKTPRAAAANVAPASSPTAAAAPTATAMQPPRARPAVPVPDPLQPKLAMMSPKTTTQRARVFGAPISSGHATAGIDKRPYVPPAPKIAIAAVDVDAMAATRAPLPVAAVPRVEPAFLDARELEQISTVEPTYPAAAMRNGQEGWVTLEFTVTETGSVSDPWVTDAKPADVFDAAAISAVRQWRFRPRVANGRAAAVRSSVTLRFEVER